MVNEVKLAGDMSSRLYIAKCPSLAELEVFIVDFIDLEGSNGPLPHTLKAKCRELARADGAILVSPTTESLNSPFGLKSNLSLWVIAKKGYMDSAKSKQRLHLLNMKVVDRVPLSQSIMQSCYQFTIMARLAPKWNKVASWLIKGSDFLTTGKAQALSLEVGITVNEITLNMIVRKLSLNALKVEDLNTTTTVLNTFKTDPQYMINETSIYSNRCLLLPNFSVGYIFSASHQIPNCHDFPNYDKVRLHWKKQHGIILPETQDLFYQVFFRFNSGKFFSYPGSCVFKSHPLVFPSREADLTAASFVADIHARVPTICGEQVKFLNKALITSAELHTAARQPATNQRFLNTKPVVPKNTHSVQLPLRRQHIPQQPNYTGSKQITSQASNTPCAPPANPHAGQVRTVPIFKTKLSSKPVEKQHPGNIRGEMSNRSDVAIVPMFKPKPTSTMRPTVSSTVRKDKGQNGRSQPPPPKRLCFAPSQSHSNNTLSLSHSNNTPSGTHTTTTSCEVPSMQPRKLPTQQIVPDLNTSLGSLDPQELSFDSPHPKAVQKPTKPRTKGPPKERLQVDGISNDIMDKIQKCKVQALRNWLQENGLKCRSKDKKDDLARMVAVHIKQSGKKFEPM